MSVHLYVFDHNNFFTRWHMFVTLGKGTMAPQLISFPSLPSTKSTLLPNKILNFDSSRSCSDHYSRQEPWRWLFKREQYVHKFKVKLPLVLSAVIWTHIENVDIQLQALCILALDRAKRSAYLHLWRRTPLCSSNSILAISKYRV